MESCIECCGTNVGELESDLDCDGCSIMECEDCDTQFERAEMVGVSHNCERGGA